ncbi:hydrolase [Rubripirellula reticaptiva]|uniref:Carboxypeptidase G2 n=1 Tax=Rubripirellula reticaptiva TaxID=2528013 RepID=A0A5C6FBV3_9BACT|nr:hydrolase [Rubripirellula reticaptiva]TWU57764.1 Carboxypeptidase G2 precursor [Rubripirellula reticaptiva]
MESSSAKLTERINAAAQWIGGRTESSVAELVRWCDQNSWSMDSTSLRSMAAMLIEDFGRVGVQFDSVELPELKLIGDSEELLRKPTGPLLVWHHNVSSKRRILMMIHYDTVYPPGIEPNRCVRMGNRLVGPGTADAKGGIAVIKLAMEAVLKFGLADGVGVSILLNPDEEIGTTASSEAIHAMVGQFDQALVFEPTLPDRSLVANRKGSGNFVFVVRGRSAHAGRNPQDGRNAIVHLAKLVPEITSLHDPDVGVLVNVGRITGGGPLNRVPDHAAVQLNVRVTDADAMVRVQQSLTDLAQQFCQDDFRVALQGEFHSPPKRVDAVGREMQQAVEQAAKFAGRSVRWSDTGGACDGSKLAAWGLKNVDTMGVSGDGLHSPTEFCEVDSIAPAALTVAALIASFAGQEHASQET